MAGGSNDQGAGRFRSSRSGHHVGIDGPDGGPKRLAANSEEDLPTVRDVVLKYSSRPRRSPAGFLGPLQDCSIRSARDCHPRQLDVTYRV